MSAQPPPTTATPASRPSAPSWRRHPAVLRLRGWATGLAATVQRVRIGPPRLPPRVDSLLFVCKGNICRSPFAAFEASTQARAAGLTVTSTSAGLKPSQARACPDEAVAAATAYGHDLRDWRPIPLSDELMAGSDLIVVMEAQQLDEVRRRWPGHRDKVVLLALFGPPPADAWSRINIRDPFGRDRAAFDACYTRIAAALGDMCARLPGTVRR